MTEPAPRLKLCVQCGAILQATDSLCPSCRRPQPAPGERRASREPEASAPSTSALRRLALPLLVVALLVAIALGLNVARRSLAERAGPTGSGAAVRDTSDTTDAAHVAVVAREAGGDAFDWAAGDVAPTVELDLQRGLEYYAIEGTTTAQIFDAIEQRGPDGPDGKAVGLTRLQSGNYLYARDEHSGRCVVTSVGATLTITLPRLTTSTLPVPVYEHWQSYANAVSEHEQRHADIYAAAAGRVAKRLRSLQPFVDRSAMEAGFNSAWVEEMDIAERKNREFHRSEAQDTALEREIVTNEIRRVERELGVVAARVEALEKRFPDLRLPPPEYEQHEADRVSYDALLAERAELIERGLWLH